MKAQLPMLQKTIQPYDFRPAKNVKWAHFMETAPTFVTRPRSRGARARGRQYEDKAQEALQIKYNEYYLPSQWILFASEDSPQPRWCQPDGMLIDPVRGRITIIEIKHSHTDRAWWQLFKLYLPVLREIFTGPWEFACCEVVKWYDPHTSCQVIPQLRRNVEDTRPGELGVHIWNP